MANWRWWPFPGQVVRLKAGGVRMTAESINLCDGVVSLVWFEGRDAKRAKVAPELLVGADVEDWPAVNADTVPTCN